MDFAAATATTTDATASVAVVACLRGLDVPTGPANPPALARSGTR